MCPEIGDTSLPAAAQLTLKAFKYLQNFLEILSIAPNITLLKPFDRYVSNQIEHLSCTPLIIQNVKSQQCIYFKRGHLQVTVLCQYIYQGDLQKVERE